MTRRHCGRRIVPQQLDQARERRAVLGRHGHERELDRREVVADGEQVELPDAIGRAVGGVATERGRLDGEWADLMCDSARQYPIDARLALDRQPVRGGALFDQREYSPPATISAVRSPIVATASGNAAMPQT